MERKLKPLDVNIKQFDITELNGITVIIGLGDDNNMYQYESINRRWYEW